MIFRWIQIVWVVYWYRLDELLISPEKHPWKARLLRVLHFGIKSKKPHGQRLREALESLGPIFVKFGQLLSTRRDLVPDDIVEELIRLQDKVPPFSPHLSEKIIVSQLGKPLQELFSSFEMQPVASASVAQVHAATLPDGRKVAVKVLRPKILRVIEKDLQLMMLSARLAQKHLADGPRLRPVEVVEEFDKTLHDELDLRIEAANCAQLQRNFTEKPDRKGLMIVPDVIWTHTSRYVFTMSWVDSVPSNQVERLRQAGVDLELLSRQGVEIFFSQVFDDGFFHADMHPGNIQVSLDPATFGQYVALDFGIVGRLSEFDKNYLAQNFLAFFRRDYHRVAALHIESGWAPPNTHVEELESAVRMVCEPIFQKPLSEISLGQLLMRLFQVSRRFNVHVQPQLVLLQKTLLNIEGMGRELNPNLDLWATAQPFLERWMHRRMGWQGLKESLKEEAPYWARTIPQLPRLMHGHYTQAESHWYRQNAQMKRLEEQLQKRRRWDWVHAILELGILVLLLYWLSHFYH